MGQLEYRMLRLKGKHGAAVWVAAGNIASEPEEVRWDEVLPEFGIGWRYETQPRWNLRFDLGFGKDSVELWAYLGEAF